MPLTIASAQRPVSRPGNGFAATLTLARWRLRQTGWLLLIACLGFVAAMIIACIVPLFTEIATSSGLQAIIQADAVRSDITLSANTQGLSSDVARSVQQQLPPLIAQKLSSYQRGVPFMAIQKSDMLGVAPTSLAHVGYFNLYAPVLDNLKPALHLISGHWPVSEAQTLEIVLTPESAQALHLTLGKQLKLQGDFSTYNATGGAIDPRTALQARLVGLFDVQSPAPLVLHGQTFQPALSGVTSIYTVVTDSTLFLQALDEMATRLHSNTIYSYQTFQLTWDYLLQTRNLRTEQVADLINRLSTAQTDLSNYQSNQHQSANNGPSSFPYITQTSIYSPKPGSLLLLSLLQQYTHRATLVSIPVTILAVQIIALLLFFVSMLVNMLLDWQMAANALLSSRGASNRQLFWSLFLQGLALCLAGIVIGPLVSVFIAFILVSRILPAESVRIAQKALVQPLQVFNAISLTAGGTLLAALFTIGLVVRYTSGLNTLTLRRETARVTRVPFWQRYYLDVLAALVAFSAYGVSLYLANIAHEVDLATQDLILAPLTLVAPIFLLLGCLLLFLRLLPWLLRLGSWAANRRNGATSMLALVQMARAPRQIIRMTLLLSLAVAFAIFAQVFSASQIQRLNDISAYETGADFSGDVANPLALQKLSMNQIITRYRAIPGVLSASADYTDQGGTVGSNGGSVAIQFRALETQSFAQTAAWDTGDSSQPLSQLLERLPPMRQTALADGNEDWVVPAVIDQSLANQLQLHVNDSFSMSLDDLSQATLNYQVTAIIAHIPTVNSSVTASTSLASGGMIVDYSTFVQIYVIEYQKLLQNNSAALAASKLSPPIVPVNHIWLNTRDDASSLASVRAALAGGASGIALTNLYDRRQIAEELQNDPFNLNILIILGIGGFVAFLLAFIGDLVSSWLSVRARRSSFVVLRALGATSRQIAGVLLWEQGIIYAGAIVLGLAFGAVLSNIAVPVLVFTGLPQHGPMSNLSIDDLYLLQHAFPVRIIIPISLDLIFATLVLVCFLALVIMIRAALHPSISSELRLSED